MNSTKLSKKLSYILRHHPEEYDIFLDEYGYAPVDDILKELGISHSALIELISDDNTKSRFTLNSGLDMIKANHGHSVKVKLEMKSSEPPFYLLHGTPESKIHCIKTGGLLKMSRRHVHLHADDAVATRVATRHEKQVVILTVRAKEMYKDGYEFYLSSSGVWLTDHVPPKYINFFKKL